MTDLQPDDGRGRTPPTGPTRRTVVRTAASAAWAAPVIVAATSTPAHAASGAAVMTTTQPSFTPVFDRIRASCRVANSGTVAPASMTVTVTISPLVGTLRDQDPTLITNGDFAFVSRSTDATTGQQTITYMKLNPQIAPNADAQFTIDFFQDSGAGEIRNGTYTVSPSVPPPGTAAPATEDYLSIGEPAREG